jgi:hypothetical protein
MQNMNSCIHKDTFFFLTQETTGEGKVGRLTVHVTKNSTSNFSSISISGRHTQSKDDQSKVLQSTVPSVACL